MLILKEIFLQQPQSFAVSPFVLLSPFLCIP